MARGNLVTAQRSNFKVAVAPTAAPADGDIIDAGDAELFIDNGSGGSINVTVLATATTQGLEVADLVVPVAAGATAKLGPFPASLFAQPADAVVGAGRVLVDYSAVASVTRAAVKH